MQITNLKKSHTKRIGLDRLFAVLITLGGWLILFTMLLLIWQLLSVTWPLLGQPELKKTGSWSLPENATLVSAGRLGDGEFAFWREGDCSFRVAHALENDWHVVYQSDNRCAQRVKVVPHQGGYLVAWLHSDGHFEVQFFEVPYDLAKVKVVLSGRLPEQPHGLSDNWQFRLLENAWAFITSSKSGAKHVTLYNRHDSSLQYAQTLHNDAVVASAETAKQLLVFQSGLLHRLPHQHSNGSVSLPLPGLKPEKLFALPGGNAFLVYDAEGHLSKWTWGRSGQKDYLKRLYRTPLQSELRHLVFHDTDPLALIFSGNQLSYFNVPTGEVVASSDFNGVSENLATYSRGFVNIVSHQVLTQFQIENSAAITTFKSLWQEVWYDGYPEPEYVWQTSSALDSHQAKYSIVPLFIGSMKAALLAVIVAVPLGIGCAIYIGYFTRQKTRRFLKPAIELIEGIPSVVIGFIAAIWLLPLAEEYLLALFLFLLLSPVFLAVFCLIKTHLAGQWRRGWELLFVFIVIVFYFVTFDSISTHQQGFINWFWTNRFFADMFANGSAKNTVILALALGFAIAPTVFSIAEDAINEVPPGLLLASFAMGANQVQTLQRVVLKAALPGIFAAVMLGFSRALGETMIVLMVSGNTPVANWDLADGVRTLTANLAIELPEAELGGVHYQILFLTALVLFTFTFFINTFAELLRHKLKLRHHHE